MGNFNYHEFKKGQSRELHKSFYESLNSCLIKYYGLKETEKVLKAMEKGLINITNLQMFFNRGNYFSDISHNLELQGNTSLSAYLFKMLLECKEEVERNPEFTISYFLFHIATKYKGMVSTKSGKSILKQFFVQFFHSFIEPGTKNKITIRMLCGLLHKEMEIENGYSTVYRDILSLLLEAYKQVREKVPNTFCIPHVELVEYITEYTRENQITFLSDIYKLTTNIQIVKQAVEHIADLGEDTPELRVALGILKEKSLRNEITEYFEDSVIAELKYIKENGHAKSFTCAFNTRIIPFWRVVAKDCTFNVKHSLKTKFFPISEAKKLITEAFAEVSVNCVGLDNFEDMKTLIHLAAEVVLIRYREVFHKGEPILNIVLQDMPWNNLDIIAEIKKEEKKLTSKYNVNFHILPFISSKSALARYGHSEPKYFRIISDLHVDINEHMNYSFNFGDDYVLCCGDVAGNHRLAVGWLNTNIRAGAIVTGNHLGYNSSYPEKNQEEGLEEMYGMQFHPENTRTMQTARIIHTLRKEVQYLNNTSTEINGIKVFGAPLYTNFELFGENRADACAMLCQNQINDFKYVKIFRKNEVAKESGVWEIMKTLKKPYITNLTPDICKFYYHRAVKKFKEFCNMEIKSKAPIVFMSHFGVSKYSIADKYKSDPVSAYFASDMTSDIKEVLDKGANLRVVAHGHVHNKGSYILKYGSKEVLVVCEPFGYYYERESNQQDQSNYGFRLSFKDVKGNLPWSVIFREKGEEISIYEI